MKAIGITKARRRLDEAQAYFQNLIVLEALPTMPEFDREWSLFLNAIGSVPEILMTSSRANPTCRQWFDGIRNRVIRKDPLLVFLAQARGTDFHGLEAGAAIQADIIGETNNPPIQIIYYEIEARDGTKQQVTPNGPYLIAGPFEYRLTTVTDRHGNQFHPPSEHLGQVLSDKKPSTVARLALAYYSGLLEEAALRAS